MLKLNGHSIQNGCWSVYSSWSKGTEDVRNVVQEPPMKRVNLCLAGLFLCSTLGLTADDDKTKASAKVIGLDIHRANVSEQIFSFNPGTSVEMLLSQPGKFILGLDPKASKLESFTDDKKTDLTSTK